MSLKLSIICTVISIAPACDEAEMLAGERIVQDADVDERAGLAPAGSDPADGVDGTLVDNAHPQAAGTCATMFEHINFDGERREVDNGAFVPWIGNLWNDQVSSMQVLPGCVVNAYEHINFGGVHATFLGSVPQVGDGWNDIISSYTCSCG